MVTYTLFLYLNVITFCFQSSLSRSMKGFEPLCASTTTASVQSLTIHFHCGHVICKNSLQGLLDVCIHCFHNRYPFFKLILGISAISFFLLFMNGGQFYLPISMLLFTFTALAIIAATTVRIITVVIIICFLSFFVEPPCEVSCFTLSFYNLTVFWCKGNAFFLNICHKDMTK